MESEISRKTTRGAIRKRMLKMSLARVSSYIYEVSGIWESILIPVVARARFVQRARTRLHFRTHVRAYTYTGRE